MAYKVLKVSKEMKDVTGSFARDATNIGNKTGSTMASGSFGITKKAKQKYGGN